MTKTTFRLKRDAHLYEHQSDWQPKLVDGCLLTSMDWFQGKFTGKPHNSWEHLWCPVQTLPTKPIHWLHHWLGLELALELLHWSLPWGEFLAISRGWRCYSVGFTMHSYQYQTSQWISPKLHSSAMRITPGITVLGESSQESSVVAIVYHSWFGHF
jgi:hypothetical protein